MYLEEAEEIFAYWEQAPPTYQLVSIIAQMLGWKPSRRVVAPQQFDAMQLFSVGIGEAPDVSEGLGAAVFDFEELKRQYAARRAG